jgi:hypothetical protein
MRNQNQLEKWKYLIYCGHKITNDARCTHETTSKLAMAKTVST